MEPDLAFPTLEDEYAASTLLGGQYTSAMDSNADAPFSYERSTHHANTAGRYGSTSVKLEPNADADSPYLDADDYTYTHTALDPVTSARGIEESLLYPSAASLRRPGSFSAGLPRGINTAGRASNTTGGLSRACAGVYTGGLAACTSWDAVEELLKTGVTHVLLLSTDSSVPDPPVPAGDPPFICTRLPPANGKDASSSGTSSFTSSPFSAVSAAGAPSHGDHDELFPLHLFFESSAAAIRAAVDAGGRAAILCDSRCIFNYSIHVGVCIYIYIYIYI